MIDFTNKNIVITGAAQGIGLTLVEKFIERGANVVAIDVKEEVFNIENERQSYTGKVKVMRKDLSQEEQVRSACAEILEHFQHKVDILINNAGVIIRGETLDLDESHWYLTMQVNVHAAYLLCKNIAPSMIENGYGKIINMASILSVLGGYQAAAYATSKGAILQMTKSLANEWGKYNIQVNCLAPGYFSTEMNQSILNSDRRKQFEDRIPANRWGVPDDLVGPTFFLASPLSDYVNGIILHVDGGAVSR